MPCVADVPGRPAFSEGRQRGAGYGGEGMWGERLGKGRGDCYQDAIYVTEEFF